jgi:hypothetical protein
MSTIKAQDAAVGGYPRDEFDDVPETAARQGVHRAMLELEPRRTGLAWLSAFAVLALLVGAFSYFILPTLGFSRASAGIPSTVPPSASAPAASAPASPAASAPAGSASTAAAGPAADPAVDKTRAVSVMNSAGPAGLAADVAARLAEDGWSIRATGEWTGSAADIPVIYYPQENRKANAEELGRLLGISEIRQDADVSNYVTVVVGPGFG